MMRKLTKVVVALLLMTAVVWAVGFTKNNESPCLNEINGSYNGHEYVDLGLPSGTLWATCNIGASKPEEYGKYFAWGETQTKDDYVWARYKYAEGTTFKDPKLTKYCSQTSYGNNGYVDRLSTLLPQDDAATAAWGNGWRMPTRGELEELLSNTTNTWTTQNGVDGRRFTSSNGKSIFIPAAGSCLADSLYRVGLSGNIWSSSLCADRPSSAWEIGFRSDYCYARKVDREYGLNIRPVHSASRN